MEILEYEFMRRAIVAGCLLAVTASILGVFMVLRRESMVGHGLSHATFAGVAIGLFFGYEPTLAALSVAILGAIFMVILKEKSGLGGDTGIGILSSLGMAFGITIATMAGDFNADLLSYLFGSILTIQPHEVWLSLGLTIITLAGIMFFFQDLIYITFDKECAVASGIEANKLDIVLGVITAFTVVVGMKVVGLLLVTALMVIPGACALLMAKSIKGAMCLAVTIGVSTVIFGLWLAFYLDLPASGTIVMVEGALLGAIFLILNLRGLKER